MAAGTVPHNITTSAGVTFQIGTWVPDTASPDVGGLPAKLAINTSGAAVAFGSGVRGADTPRLTLADDDPAVSSFIKPVALTTSASPDYSDQDVIGGKLTVANAVRASTGGSILNLLSISSKSALPIATRIKVYIFKADPASSTLTDNAAMVIHADDVHKILDCIVVETFDWVTPLLAVKRGLGIPFQPTSGTSLFAAAFADGGTIDLASTSDLTFNFGFL